MSKKIKQIRITHAQRTWLRGIHSHFGRGVETDTRSLKVELLDKLPKDFDPSEIDQRLLRGGVNLTVLGWGLLDSENQLVTKTNRVIKCVRELLLRNPRIEQIHVNDVSGLIDMAVDQVAVIFEKLSQIGVFHDGGTSFGPIGWATIRISEQAFDNYLKFESIEQILRTIVVDRESLWEPIGAEGEAKVSDVRGITSRRDMNLETLRTATSEEQRSILDQIWDYFLKNDSGIPCGALYHQFGKERTTTLLRDLGGSVVSSGQTPRERYLLTFLGTLLTTNGASLELMFLQYLSYVKKRLEDDVELKAVTSEEVEPRLQFDAKDAQIFGQALRLSPFMNGGSWNAKSWSSGLPFDIDDLMSEVTVQEYFHGHLFRNYDPNLPVEGSRQLSYINAKTQKTFDSKIERYDVFLSYASADKREADEIYVALEAAGAKTFQSKKNLKAGDDFAEEIREALRESEELWLLLTPESLNSEWVISEWAAAWALGKRIVPILSGCAPEQAPERIRRLQCTDFANHHQLIAAKFRF